MIERKGESLIVAVSSANAVRLNPLITDKTMLSTSSKDNSFFAFFNIHLSFVYLSYLVWENPIMTLIPQGPQNTGGAA